MPEEIVYPARRKGGRPLPDARRGSANPAGRVGRQHAARQSLEETLKPRPSTDRARDFLDAEIRRGQRAAVPYGQLWRTGTNEPTMPHTTTPLDISGIRIEAGSYSLYTIPGEEEWTLIVNGSMMQWGHIARYASREPRRWIGPASPRRELPGHVEVLTLRPEPAAGHRTTVVLEWEHTRVRIPVATPAHSP